MIFFTYLRLAIEKYIFQIGTHGMHVECVIC